MKTVCLNGEYTVAHAEVVNDAVLGLYNLVWQLSTKDELPRTWFCYLCVESSNIEGTLSGPFYVVDIVECVDALEQSHEQKLTRFKKYEGLTWEEVGLYAKIISTVNGHSVYGYLPTDLLKEL